MERYGEIYLRTFERELEIADAESLLEPNASDAASPDLERARQLLSGSARAAIRTGELARASSRESLVRFAWLLEQIWLRRSDRSALAQLDAAVITTIALNTIALNTVAAPSDDPIERPPSGDLRSLRIAGRRLVQMTRVTADEVSDLLSARETVGLWPDSDESLLALDALRRSTDEPPAHWPRFVQAQNKISTTRILERWDAAARAAHAPEAISGMRDLGVAMYLVAPPPAPKDVIRPVWYGTDRKPRTTGYSDERDTALHLGRYDVRIPPGHRFGEREKPWWRLPLWGSDEALTIVHRNELTEPDFVTDLATVLSTVSSERAVTIFVHGYCTDFDGAIIKAAQLGEDLRLPAVAAFSWPSRGKRRQYPSDEDAVVTSESAFRTFVSTVASAAGTSRIDLIAHSMGNRLIVNTALQLIDDGIDLGRVVLAAADVDRVLFLQNSPAYARLARNLTMYVSPKDRALGLSHFLHANDRAGFTPPVTVVPPIQTIDVGDIDLTLIGHEYYSAAQPVLRDMNAFLSGQLDAGTRQQLRAVPAESYWEFTR